MASPEPLEVAAERYFALRRKLGYALRSEREEVLLFARRMDGLLRRTITLPLVISWARSARNGSPKYAAWRYEAVRRFLTVAACTRRHTVTPPPGYLGRPFERRAPHVYSDAEVQDLLAATRGLTPTAGLRPWTYRTLFGLLAATGLRIGEALALDRSDVDGDRETLLVRRDKSRSTREIPLHRSVLEVLAAYGARRDERHPAPRAPAFFLTESRGTRLRYPDANIAFRKLRRALGWSQRPLPAALPIAQRVLAIPTKRFDRRLVGYLTHEEMQAVLAAPDAGTWSGRRDHAMLLTAYNTAARVSELAGVQRADAELAPALGTVKIHGKGRKERVVVLSRDATAVLRRWGRELPPAAVALFPNRAGKAMTRSGVHARLRVAVERAAESCPSLRGRRVSPHTIRHTTAMHLLRSGLNLAAIALFLGHEDVQTTHGYVEADAEMKRKTLASLPRLARARRRRPEEVDELVGFLESLQREHRPST